MEIDIIRKSVFKKKTMIDNVCDCCGNMIMPGAIYYTDGMIKICARFCKKEVSNESISNTQTR